MDYFTPDLFVELSKYLSLKEFIQLTIVCQHFKNIIRGNDAIWFSRLISDYEMVPNSAVKLSIKNKMNYYELYRRMQYHILFYTIKNEPVLIKKLSSGKKIDHIEIIHPDALVFTVDEKMFWQSTNDLKILVHKNQDNANAIGFDCIDNAENKITNRTRNDKEPVKTLTFSIGNNYMGIITKNNDLYMMGGGHALGIGGYGICPDPQKIPLHKKITHVSWYRDHTAIIANKELHATGRNDRGQLGLGHKVNEFKFAHVSALSDVTQVSCGDLCTMAVANGKVYSFGCGAAQLGLGEITETDVPVQIEGFGEPTSILCDYLNSYIITNKKLYACGGNASGQIGSIKGTGHHDFIINTFQQVPDLDNVKKVVTTREARSSFVLCGDRIKIYGELEGSIMCNELESMDNVVDMAISNFHLEPFSFAVVKLDIDPSK